MKFRIRFADQIVGIFVLIALGFLVLIMILMGANQRWFAKDYYYSSRFASGEGLSIGMAIDLKGFQIGKISDITLNDDNEVDIEFYVYDTYFEKVRENSVLELKSNALGLGGGLVFHPGKYVGTPLAEFSFIPSLNSGEGQRLLEQGLVEIPEGDDAINRIMGKTEKVMDNVNRVMAKTATVMDSVTRVTNSTSDLMDSIRKGIKGDDDGALSQTLNNVQEITGQLNKELSTILDDVSSMTSTFRDPTGLIPKLLDAKGSLAQFLDDDNALYDQISAILVGIDETIMQITEFSSFINSSSPQISGLLETTRETLDKSQDVIEGVKNNPLIRGGIPEEIEQPTTFESYRDEDF